MDNEHPGTEELARRLDAYASARLAPRRGSAARLRRALIEDARMRHIEATIGGRRRRGSGLRRASALVLAAVLGLATGVAAFAGSAPGTPLYEARIWLQSITLPADVDARALERIRQIDGLLVDAEKAAAEGSPNAIAAAAQAYGDAVADAVDEVIAVSGSNDAPGSNEAPEAPGSNDVPGSNEAPGLNEPAGAIDDRLTRLEAALGNHVLVLEALADKLPDAAADGIGRALEASQKAIEKLGHTEPSEEPAP